MSEPQQAKRQELCTEMENVGNASIAICETLAQVLRKVRGEVPSTTVSGVSDEAATRPPLTGLVAGTRGTLEQVLAQAQELNQLL